MSPIMYVGIIAVLGLVVCICMNIRHETIIKRAKIDAEALTVESTNQAKIAKYQHDTEVSAVKAKYEVESQLQKEKFEQDKKLQDEKVKAELMLERMRLDPDFFINEQKDKDRLAEIERDRLVKAEEDKNKKKESPYIINRTRNRDTWGYSIYFKSTGKPLTSEGYHQFFRTASAALETLNEMEALQGYIKTKV